MTERWEVTQCGRERLLIRDIPHEIVTTMTEDSGEHHEEGEEEGRPVGDVGEEEVVDMDTTLGSKDKVH